MESDQRVFGLEVCLEALDEARLQRLRRRDLWARPQQEDGDGRHKGHFVGQRLFTYSRKT